MHSAVSPKPSLFKHTALALVLLATLCGCESVTGLRPGGGDKAPLARALDLQIAELDLLATATYQERVDIYRDIELAYVDDPSDANRLRLALAKGVEGHPASDLQAALTELSTLLGKTNTLSPTQMRLARMASRDIEEHMIVAAELAELRAKVSNIEQSSVNQTSRVDRRLQSARGRVRELEQENTRLAEELAQARDQLDAIMSIETSSAPSN